MNLPKDLRSEAFAHIEESINANQNGSRETSHIELRLAAIKATLYAAEQQHIANLIAIYSAENADAFELMPEEAKETFGPMFGRILAEIREGLDLL